MSDVESRGRRFERDVGVCLIEMIRRCPNRSTLIPQATVLLNDGRKKQLDFCLKYTTIASAHEIAIECQDRERWDSSILDKILAIRAHSKHNRFWYIYRDESFLSEATMKLLGAHGIMYWLMTACAFVERETRQYSPSRLGTFVIDHLDALAD